MKLQDDYFHSKKIAFKNSLTQSLDRSFLENVTRAGSLQKSDTLLSAIPCAKKINPECDGTLLLLKNTNQKTISWSCDGCEDYGDIHDWQDTEFDLESRAEIRNNTGSRNQFREFDDFDETHLSVFITQNDYSSLLEIENSYLDPTSECVIFSARREKALVALTGYESELESLFSLILSLSKYEEAGSERERALNLIACQLRSALQSS